MRSARHQVINMAVQIENNITLYLAYTLKISKPISSRSLGTKSSALSFSHKLTLLLDLGILSKREVTLFTKFAEMRNKFAHLAHIDSFESYFKLVPDHLKFMTKRYQLIPEEHFGIEEMYTSVFNEMCVDLLNIMGKLIREIE